MSIYVIGDIQGCFNSFKLLLNKIKFDKTKDILWLTGDIINRGPDSDKMLKWSYDNQNNIKLVLGNHDIHAIAVYYGVRKQEKDDTLDKLLNLPNIENLINWLRSQPLIYQEDNNLMVHAGIPPQLSITQINKYAKNISDKISKDKDNAIKALDHIFSNQSSTDIYTINALTRMRHCNKLGELDLKYKGPDIINNKYKAWFLWEQDPSFKNIKIFFGHWAALSAAPEYQDIIKNNKFFPLDTGCVWGKKLTAIRLEDYKIFSVNFIN